MSDRLIALLVTGLLIRGIPCGAQEEAEVIVYGGTPAGVMAAVAAARLGEKVILVEPSRHLGGVVAGGLTRSDVGQADTIGGLAREFFDRVLAHYQQVYGPDSPQVRDCNRGYYFEPSVAEAIFEQMVGEQPGILLYRHTSIEAVERDNDRLLAVWVRRRAIGDELKLRGTCFIDASYEGDLLALAAVPYRIGREAEREYGESLAGVWLPPEEGSEQVQRADFGVFSFITLADPAFPKEGDDRIQAYNYRLCLTDAPELRVLPERPPHYDPRRYALLLAAVRARPISDLTRLLSILPVPNRKYDANNHWPWQSSDFVGGNYLYLAVDMDTREAIAREHRDYLQGMLYFLQNDPQVPPALQEDARRWGLARDEFVDNDHFPHQLYVREARRLLGAYVMREQDCRQQRYKPDRVGIGSYMIDSHAVQRFLYDDGLPAFEGMMGGTGTPVQPYEIPYRSLIPQRERNLLVPVCLSATHVAYCTLRMEPVYMMMGHTCGVAAHLACRQGTSVQAVPIDRLQALLAAQGARLEVPQPPQVRAHWQPELPQPGQEVHFRAQRLAGRAPLASYWWDLDGDTQVDSTEAEPTFIYDRDGVFLVWLRVRDEQGWSSQPAWSALHVGRGRVEPILLDDDQAELVGAWSLSTSQPGYLGEGYRHQGPGGDPASRARYHFQVSEDGRYRILLSYTAHANRAAQAPVVVRHRDGEARLTVDQRRDPGVFPFVILGEFPFAAGQQGQVEIGVQGAGGYVIADAVVVHWVSAQ